MSLSLGAGCLAGAEEGRLRPIRYPQPRIAIDRRRALASRVVSTTFAASLGRYAAESRPRSSVDRAAVREIAAQSD